MKMQAFRELDPGNVAVSATAPEVDYVDDGLADCIERAVQALRAEQSPEGYWEQSPEGYWSYEFEADCSIPAEYILMMHFMDEVNEEIERKIAVYLRSKQGQDDGWALYPGGELDLSASVKTYYALKLAGDSPDAPHMARARAAILARGGPVNASPSTPTSSPRLRWRCSVRSPGVACPSSRWKSCCCPDGFLFISPRFPIGRAP
jgi:hypothetical protein